MSVVDILQWIAIIAILLGWLWHNVMIHRIVTLGAEGAKHQAEMARIMLKISQNLNTVGQHLGLTDEDKEGD